MNESVAPTTVNDDTPSLPESSIYTQNIRLSSEWEISLFSDMTELAERNIASHGCATKLPSMKEALSQSGHSSNISILKIQEELLFMFKELFQITTQLCGLMRTIIYIFMWEKLQHYSDPWFWERTVHLSPSTTSGQWTNYCPPTFEIGSMAVFSPIHVEIKHLLLSSRLQYTLLWKLNFQTLCSRTWQKRWRLGWKTLCRHIDLDRAWRIQYEGKQTEEQWIYQKSLHRWSCGSFFVCHIHQSFGIQPSHSVNFPDTRDYS